MKQKLEQIKKSAELLNGRYEYRDIHKLIVHIENGQCVEENINKLLEIVKNFEISSIYEKNVKESLLSQLVICLNSLQNDQPSDNSENAKTTATDGDINISSKTVIDSKESELNEQSINSTQGLELPPLEQDAPPSELIIETDKATGLIDPSSETHDEFSNILMKHITDEPSGIETENVNEQLRDVDAVEIFDTVESEGWQAEAEGPIDAQVLKEFEDEFKSEIIEPTINEQTTVIEPEVVLSATKRSRRAK